jgi:hypothetical protein
MGGRLIAPPAARHSSCLTFDSAGFEELPRSVILIISIANVIALTVYTAACAVARTGITDDIKTLLLGYPAAEKPLVNLKDEDDVDVDAVLRINGACVSHTSDVLGVCVMVTPALLRTETGRRREEYTIARPARSHRRVLGRLGMTIPVCCATVSGGNCTTRALGILLEGPRSISQT